MEGQQLDSGSLRRPASIAARRSTSATKAATSAAGSVAATSPGKLQQGHDRSMALGRGFAVRDRVAPDAELALERGRQPIDERRPGRRPSASAGILADVRDVQPVARLASRAASAPATRIARRTSGRPKNRSPRTWNGMPARPKASSKAGSWAFVRTRTAIEPCGDARPRERPDRSRRSPATSASACGNPPISGAGPPGSVGTSRFGGRGERPGSRSSRRRSPRRQDAVRQAEHLGRRAVVALEMDKARCRKPLGEPDEVVTRSPGERVDRLVLVADDSEVVPPAEPSVEERLLERVRVLVLVDREPAVPVADLVGDARVGLDQPDRQLQHVLEVDPPGAPLGRLVAAVQTGHQVGAVAARRDRSSTALASYARGADPPRLRPLDLSGEVPDGEVPIAARQVRRRAARGSAPSTPGSRAPRSRGRAARNGGAGGVQRHGTWPPSRPGARGRPAGPPSRPPPSR